MKSAEDLFRSLGREKTLYIRDKKDQNAQEDQDLDRVVNEKQSASSDPVGGIQPAGVQRRAYKAFQPLHTEDLVLNKIPN